MPTIPAAIQSNLDAGYSTLATCWYVLLKNGTELGFTDHDQDIVYQAASISANSITYAANSGVTASARTNTNDLAVDNSEFSGPLASGGLSLADAEAGLYDSMTVKIFKIDWKTPANGIIKIQSGIMGDFVRQDSMYTAEMRSLAQKLRKRTGKRIMPLCDSIFGDTACGKDLSGLTETGTIATLTDSKTLTIGVTGTNYADKYTLGTIEFTSGDASGDSYDIKSYDVDTAVIVLQEDMITTPSTGDAFTIIAGCDKTFYYCQGIHNNQINFQGFPYVPVGDIIYQVSSEPAQPSQIASSTSGTITGGQVPGGTNVGYQRTFVDSDISIDASAGIEITLSSTDLTVVANAEFDIDDSVQRAALALDSVANQGARLGNFKNSGKWIISVINIGQTRSSLAATIGISLVSATGNNYWRNSTVLGDFGLFEFPAAEYETWNSISYTDSLVYPLINKRTTQYDPYDIIIDLDNNAIWIKTSTGWLGGNPFSGTLDYLSTGIAFNMSNRSEPVTVAFLPSLSDNAKLTVNVTGRTYNLSNTELQALITAGYVGWDAA